MSPMFSLSFLRKSTRGAMIVFALLAAAAVMVPWVAPSGVDAETAPFEWVETSDILGCGSVMKCAEWCLVGPNGHEPTGRICCVDQNAIGTNDSSACGDFRGPDF